MKIHELEVAEVAPETDESVRVTFSVPSALAPQYAFTPGQYLTLEREFEGIPLRRAYSLCSVPGEPLQVGVKLAPDGRFSTYANQGLAAGGTAAGGGSQRRLHRRRQAPAAGA